MELIKSAAKRSKVSDIVYIILNLALAGAVFGMTVAFSPPYVAYMLVLLSKWRVFAVRPRFWLANIQTNLVDAFVGLSIVTLIWQASGAVLLQLVLALLYAGWLLIIKPRSRRTFIVLQASVSQMVSLIALFSLAHYVDSVVTVAVAWLVGYICARHILDHYEEEDITLLAMMWAILVAEISWLATHWMVTYRLGGNLLLPQAVVIISIVGYVMVRVYDAVYHRALSWTKVRSHVLFAAIVIAILLLKEISEIVRITG